MFYGTETGNRLVDENNYSKYITEYLKLEKSILEKEILKHDTIIEVGCMEARNLDLAINNKKKYIGIDIVPEYINIANELIQKRNLQENCEFLCINAEQLNNIKEQSNILKFSKSPLFFFPFNSFGNMDKYENVIYSMKKIKNSDFKSKIICLFLIS